MTCLDGSKAQMSSSVYDKHQCIARDGDVKANTAVNEVPSYKVSIKTVVNVKVDGMTASHNSSNVSKHVRSEK